MQTQKLSIDLIKENPNNPRIIKDDKFKKLVQSMKDFPEMAEVREVVVNASHMILGGNMRFKAMKEAGWKEVPVRVVDWSEEKQREFIIKDNVSGGEWDWDTLPNEYDFVELDSWGVDLPKNLTGEDSSEQVMKLTVELESAEELESLFSELDGRGYKVKTSNR
jgi:ParB-like chromosome segregation protein Spo0J